jgi:hypothetical protein
MRNEPLVHQKHIKKKNIFCPLLARFRIVLVVGILPEKRTRAQQASSTH